MLERASESGVISDSECNDPAVLLACALGSDGCPAKCAEAENKSESSINPYEGVQAGDLNIAVSTSSAVTSIPYDGIVKVAELSVKASENIQLQSLTVTRLWLSTNSWIKVWIEKDWKRITSSSSFYGDSTAELTFNNNGYVVNGNDTLDLVVSLDGTKQAAGAELQFKVSGVVSSSKNTTVSPDTTGIFRTTTYQATSVSITQVAGSRSYDVAEDSTFSFWEFKVLNDSKASEERNVLIRNITFKVEGSIENLSSFKLLRDSKEISSNYNVDGKSLTFTVNDQLDSGKSATYKVTAVPTNIESSSGDNYTLSIKKAEDVIAEEIGENASAYRVSVYNTSKTAQAAAGWWNAISLWTTTIKGGNFTLTRDSNFSSTVNAGWGYSDVTIAKGTFKANQAVKYEGGLTILTWTSYANALNTVIRRATLTIWSRTYQAEINTGSLKFDSEIYIDKGSHDVELKVSLVTTPVAGISEVKLSNIDATSFGNGNYLNSDETTALSGQIAWSIRVATINITEEKMWLKKTGPSDDVKVVQGNTDERIVLQGTITNTTDKELSISNFVITGTNLTWATLSWGSAKFADVYVKLGDRTSSRVAFSAKDSVDSSYNTAETQTIDISSTIEAGKTVDFVVYAMPNANLKDSDQFRFSVAVNGKADGNDIGSSSLTSAYIKVKGEASTSAVASTARSKIIFPGVSTEVAAFEYTVKNDNAEIATAVITGLDGSKISDLTIDFGGSVWSPALSYTPVSNTVATFNSRLSIPEGTYNVKVYATFDEDAISNNAQEVSGVTFYDGSATRWTVTLTNNKHYIAKAYPVLNRESYSSDKDAPSLEIGITKVVKNGDSATVAITALSWYYMSWTTAQSGTNWAIWLDNDTLRYFFKWSDNLDMSNLSTSKEILKSSTAKIHITSVSFKVTDSDGKETTYSWVTVNSIADFAKLTNE